VRTRPGSEDWKEGGAVVDQPNAAAQSFAEGLRRRSFNRKGKQKGTARTTSGATPEVDEKGEETYPEGNSG